MPKCTLNKLALANLDLLVGNFDTARCALLEALQEHQGDWQDEIDTASERWLDSDNGQAAQERLSQLDEMCSTLEDFEMPSLDDLTG